MTAFDIKRLRALREAKEITAAEVARRMSTSPAQIHKLEKGLRRLTVDALISYCDALGVSPGHLLTGNAWVPVTGAIDSDFQVQPLPPGSESRTLAPPLREDMDPVAALRWAAGRRFRPMLGHLVFYLRSEAGVPESAWNKRCLVMRKDGSQCLGWPIRDNDKAHIDVGDGPAEFNVEIISASPVIAVIPPFAIRDLRPPDD